MYIRTENGLVNMTKEEAEIYLESIKPEKSYVIKRKESYPSMAELNDAEVKIHSGDPDLIAEGEAQKAKYVADCLQVKLDYPKTEEEV